MSKFITVAVIIIAAFTVVIFLSRGFILDRAGKYLYQKDELVPADVIVVLSGEKTERVEYGVKLYQQGYAKKNHIIMTGGLGVGRHTWASLMKEYAEQLGIPGDVITLVDEPRSTEEEARYSKQLFMERGYKSIILITSPYHSKRAFKIFHQVMGQEIKIISAPVEDSWLNLDGWWQRRRDKGFVLSEYSKFVWLWIFGVQ